MKEKYTYKSEYFDIFIYAALIIVIILVLLNSFTRSSAVLAALVIFLVILMPLSVLLFNMPGRFCADESSVTFGILKKRTIPYNTIKSIELSREYIKGQLRGEPDRYVETLKFTCESGEHSFQAFIDIDLEATAENPEVLAETFAQSKFTRLKGYIDLQTPKTTKEDRQ